MLGDQYFGVIGTVPTYACFPKALDNFSKAESIFERAWKRAQATLRKNHPMTFYTHEKFGDLSAAECEFDKAKLCCQEVWEGRDNMLGRAHVDTVRAHNKIKELEAATEEVINHAIHYCHWPALIQLYGVTW